MTLFIIKSLLTGGAILLKLTLQLAPQLAAIEVIFEFNHSSISLKRVKLVHLTVPKIFTFSAITLKALPPSILPKVITTGSKGSNFLVIASCIPVIIFEAAQIESIPS